MGDVLPLVFTFFHMLLLLDYSSSHPLCTDRRSPFTSKTTLAFCQYSGSVCCNSTQDKQMQNRFKLLNISASSCGSLLKSILCSKCDKFSADLYRVESSPQQAPVLCNSNFSADSSQDWLPSVNFCSKVWDECHNITISNNPFGEMPFNTTSKIVDIWQSKKAFCDQFGGPADDELPCFDGKPVSLNNSVFLSPPSGVCLEKIGNGSYLNMAAHPDGSNRVFLSSQEGKIWLANVPDVGSGEGLMIEESKPFLDITDKVYSDAAFGMLGIAFHSNYEQNGRFFVSFNCDKVKWSQCSGRCSCNSAVGCDPLKLVAENGAQPCRYHSIITEFTANGTASQPSSVTSANPLEVRRIFTMGLPFTSHHGGQILFGPKDGYLYFMMGDGGSAGDPYNFAQNKKSLLGKILRIDIDSLSSSEAIVELGLWGNYSVPMDNPFSEDMELAPEIWALGFRNPWRCSFDSERPSYFLCADVGQDEYEEVDIVTKGGNYGWRVYEGPLLYNPPKSPGGNTSVSSIHPIFPVMGYNHSEVSTPVGSASITGGYYYRSMTDPCLYGRYLFADLYAGGVWAGTESPKNSGNFTTTKAPLSCASDSPIKCSAKKGSSIPALGFIFSFGQDNRKDVFILTSSGVYRIVPPSRCHYTCSKENVTTYEHPRPTPSFSISIKQLSWSNPFMELLPFISLLLLSFEF